MLILTFTAGGNRYAVDVAQVVELVPRVELRLIPHAPGFLAGFLGYRGQVVPVIDLGLLLGAGPVRIGSAPGSSWSKPSRAITINRRGIGPDRPGNPGCLARDENPDRDLLGLIAEQVGDLTRVQPEQVVPAPVSLPQAPYLDTIAQTDQGFVPLVEDLEIVIGHWSLVIESFGEPSGPSILPGRDPAGERSIRGCAAWSQSFPSEHVQ